MKYTNHFNLSEPIYNALTYDSYIKVGDISATGLIKPPQMSQLEKRYDDQITVDASDNVWMLLGTAVHTVIEFANKDGNSLQEERLTMNVFGWVVSGQPDLLNALAVLRDYKCTSVWSFIFGDKPEWECQVNTYAELYRHYDFPVNEGWITAILRDFQQSKASEDNYPKCGIHEVQVALWEPSEAIGYIERRVDIHQKAEKLADEDLPPCTDLEMWARPDSYAVMKEGRKTALRVLNSYDEAMSWREDKVKAGDKTWVEHRKGERVRCERTNQFGQHLYCHAAPFCHQFKKFQESKDKS